MNDSQFGRSNSINEKWAVPQGTAHKLNYFDNNDTVSNGFIWFHLNLKPCVMKMKPSRRNETFLSCSKNSICFTYSSSES